MNTTATETNDTDLTDIALRAAGLFLCGFALLLPLYYSPWLASEVDRLYLSYAPSDAILEERPSTPPRLDIAAPTHYEIMHSAHRRGLMLYDGYVYLLRQGDILPDGSPFGNFTSDTTGEVALGS